MEVTVYLWESQPNEKVMFSKWKDTRFWHLLEQKENFFCLLLSPEVLPFANSDLHASQKKNPQLSPIFNSKVASKIQNQIRMTELF